MPTKQQLDREIAEALARKDKPTTWMQSKALRESGEYAGCDTFLLTYLPYHEMAPYAPRSAYGWGSYEECFDTFELARRRLQQLSEEGRIEWAKIYQHDQRYPLQRKLVDEWEDRPNTHSTIKKRSTKGKREAASLERRRQATEVDTAWRNETINQVRQWIEENRQGPWDDRTRRIVIGRLTKLITFVRFFFPGAGEAPFAAWDAAALIVLPRQTALRLARRLFSGGPGIAKDLQAEDLTFNMDWFRPADFQ